MKPTVTYFLDDKLIEDNATSQIDKISDDENISDICIYPDIHYCSDKGIPVGLTFTTTDMIYPLITGKDMGCGVAYMKIPKTESYKDFDKEKHYKAFHREHLTMTDEGLGGGNHFLSLEEDDKNLYIIVHTGTRNLGIAMFQKNLALLNGEECFSIDFLNENCPDWFTEYNSILEYGIGRRKQFLEGTLKFLIRNKYVEDGDYEIGDSIHNHIKLEDGKWIHRKGSTELNNDVVVIPLSMTRGSLLVKQTHDSGNLNSCSHGAGRQLSRTNTLKYWHSSLKKKQKKQYEADFCELLDRSGKFSQGYIQEFDFAYKDTTNILRDQPFLKKVTETTPICTIKFSEI